MFIILQADRVEALGGGARGKPACDHFVSLLLLINAVMFLLQLVSLSESLFLRLNGLILEQ